MTARWPGEGLAELRLHQTTIASETIRCPESGDVELPLFIAMIVQDLEAEVPLIVKAPVTEGSFYIFSLLDAVQRMGRVSKDGTFSTVEGGVTARYTFTVEVLYSIATD